MFEKSIEIIPILSTLGKIKVQISQLIDQTFQNIDLLEINYKKDSTIVTNIDIFISNLFKTEFLKLYPFLHFYSEEEHSEFQYPLIILDPIDGTKELAQGIGECAVSFGIYFSPNFDDPRNFSWIYNPFTGFEISSESLYSSSVQNKTKPLLGLVSRTESEKGSFKSTQDRVYKAKGSIAFKLGLLASGACDFVETQRPKNIWDIMAGSHICFKRGIKIHVEGVEISSLETKLVPSPISWSY